MGMNDDGLTPREHAEMRDLVLAGTQRIRPAGSRRNQIIAGALALVLIGAVSGAAITTAAIFGSDTTAATPTPSPTTATSSPTPTAEPTPSATPTPAPSAEGGLPFAGECEGALTDDEATTAAGIPVGLADYRWRTGAIDLLGGIDCLWLSTETYAAAAVQVFVYPVEVVPSDVADGIVPGCTDLGYSNPTVQCSLSGVIDGTWVLVRSSGDPATTTEDGIRSVFDRVSANVVAYPSPSPAQRVASWWGPMDCDQLVAQIDPVSYGFERVALLESDFSAPVGGAAPETIPDVPGTSCDLHFTAGSGDDTSGEVVNVSIVPGGASAFPTAVAAVNSVPFEVAGAQAAVIAPGLDRYEGSGSVIVATDGINMLMVTPDFIRETSAAGSIADAAFAMMRP
ncbi:hypothetical protein SAMN04487846_1410 [Microbacterium sp. cf046]|uniref:hypothetical protein n=1 Tax=Microbacterium sp. cf046 TaxID=1761803 RepID=UPI0008DFEC72|nr:hypothetical protein [Microbacterium sp. cf046]SFS00797.1 hypothetical protein SAMN04487846_1410 [Microbacterium sp. cf046]